MSESLIRFSENLRSPVGTLGIGVFDGLHRGHHCLLEKCDAVLSFNPHPDRVLGKSADLKLLSTPNELQVMSPKIGFLTFTKEIAAMPPDVFLNDIIRDRLAPKALVVGFDFRFGYKQQGSPESLKAWGQEHGIHVEIVPAVEDEKGPIKSERIRQAFKEGFFEEALTLLGHPYLMIGQVIRGEGRGRQLGFPTANLQFPEEKLIPSLGVYSGLVTLENASKPAMIYVGRKPTFSGAIVGVEVHIPDFAGSLYDAPLSISLTHFIRPEKTFGSKEELIAQIHQDIHRAKNYHTL